MSEQTAHLKLELPAGADYYNVGVTNANSQKLDAFAGTVGEQLPRTCTTTYTPATRRHTLTPSQGGLALPDVFAVRFVAAAGFAAGDTLYLDGVEYTPAYTDSAKAVEAGRWRAGAVVEVTLDKVGKRAYVGESLEGKADIAEVCRPNLLDVWWFGAGVINQRGQTSYTGAVYGIDRWKSSSSETTVSLAGGAISQIRCTSPAHFIFSQFIENFLTFAGQIVTASILVEKVESGSFQLTLIPNANDSSTRIATAVISSPGLYTVTGVLTDTPDQLQFALRSHNNPEGATFRPVAAKLEVGERQTLARKDAAGKWVLNDPPPHPATLLAQCQRYQIIYNAYIYIRASQVTANYIEFVVWLPSPMRITPSCTWDGVSIKTLGGTTKTGFTFTIERMKSNALYIRATQEAHGMADAMLALAGTIFDANL